jgi:ABC-type transport system substrate-binding protein
MASFFSFLTTKKFPSRTTLRSILRGPLTFLKALVYAVFFLICIAVYILILTINSHFLTTVPARGGSLTEGVIGAPHFINPILATTDTDVRLVSLIYGSLMTTQPDGSMANSLAQSYSVSPDGKTYTVTLLPHAKFDDGSALTSGDVLFTVTKLQDSSISNNATYWQGISVATPDASTAVFTLPAADSTFLSHLNFGILPQHVWKNISDATFDTTSLNIHPIGSGLFKLSSTSSYNSIPVTMALIRNKYAVQGTPLLDGLTMNFYSDQTDLLGEINDGSVDFTYGLQPQTLTGAVLNPDLKTASISTDNTINLYRSASDTSLSSGTTVAALSSIIDKNAIIATVLHGYGTPAGAPMNAAATSLTQSNTSALASVAKKGFSIAVENDPTLLLAAHTLASQLGAQGIPVSVNAFDPGTFQTDITANVFPVFLARNGDQAIPSTYAVTIPLYTESIPYIFNSNIVHLIPPETYQGPATEYEHIQSWYTRTNKLWKWFIRK